jgi:cbb3-type cytochrome c oxidase subunit III
MKKALSLSLLTLAFALVLVALGREAGLHTTAAATSARFDAKAVYDAKCVKCHLADGKGLDSLQPPNFTDAKWQASRTNAQLTASINNGKGTMPAFKGTLSPADIKALVTMVRGFAPKGAAAAKKK